jgi:ell wall binding domain 2 (CWB2)
VRRPVHRMFMIAVALAVVGVSCPGAAAFAASADPAWAPAAVNNYVAPSDSGDLSTAFDSATGQFVALGIVGGPFRLGPETGNLVCTVGDPEGTWTFDGAVWVQHQPAGTPRARGHVAMAYDSATKQLVAFGGEVPPCGTTPTDTPTSPPGAFADTWTWNGSIWSQQHPAGSPPAAGGGCAAFDASSGQLLMYGGQSPSAARATTYRTATWQWTGSTWVQLTTASTPPGGNCAMTYDAASGLIVMLVGSDPTVIGSPVQTWQWDGTSWTRAADLAVPVVRTPIGLASYYGAAEPPPLAFDPDTGEALAWVNTTPGPQSGGVPTTEMWAWDGSSWTMNQAANEPILQGSAFGYDDATGQLILFGRTFATVQTALYAVPGSSAVTPTRVFGADRESTAVAASASAFPAAGSASAVVLARSDAFADALTGGPLAAAKHAPLLLTSPGELDATTTTEIGRVLPTGGTVYLLGGTSALSAAVASAVTALGDVPVRIAGADRFATAVAIANALGDPTTVFEATGLNFPDALSAVPAAVTLHGAILLTDGSSQSAATARYLGAHAGARYAIGGAAAWADPTATAFAGINRYDTSAAVAYAFFPHATAASVADGDNFPDALAGGPLAGVAGQPMLLLNAVGPVAEPIAAYLFTHAAQTTAVRAFGGSAAVTDRSLNDVARVLAGTYFPQPF